MTPHEALLLHYHHKYMAGHHFCMLMMRLGVRMRVAPIEDLVRGGV